jgi:hypothetical protein
MIGVLTVFGGATASAMPTTPTHSIYWGGTFGGAPYDWASISSFESSMRKNVSLVGVGAPFANCGSDTCADFPASGVQVIRSHGAVPLVNYSTMPSSGSFDNFTDQDVADGRYDSVINAWAKEAKSYGQPFLLRFDWEMNGGWWSYGTLGHGSANSAAEFVAMWRHVHTIFDNDHVTNATWVWCPNVDPGNHYTSLASLYPGDAYVNWTCLDGYNWGTTGPNSPGALRGGWQSFNQLFRSSYNQIVNRIAPSKPMMIGEVGAVADGGSQSAWIENMLKTLPTLYPKVHGLVWYQLPAAQWNFALSPGTASFNMFSRWVGNAHFAHNTFCRLSSPIRPPAYPAPARPSCAGS